MMKHQQSRSMLAPGLIGVMLLTVFLSGIHIQAQLQPLRVSDFAWSPDGEKFAVGGGDWQCGLDVEAYGIRIFDVSTQTLLLTLEGHTCTVITIEWSPNGNYLVSGSMDGVARVWDTITGNLISSTEIFSPDARLNQSWNPDGTLIADVQGSNKIIHIWDPSSGQLISNYESNERISSHRWNSDSNNSFIAIGIFNGVQLLDPHTMTIVRSLPTSIPVGDINKLVWSPNNLLLAGGSAEGTIHVWNILSGLEVALLSGHTTPIIDLGWNSDGTAIISGADNTVRVWDVTTSQQIEQYVTQGFPTSVGWIPDGSQIAFSGNLPTNSVFGVDIIPAPQLITCTNTILANDTPALLSAIASANTTPEADTICLEAGTYTLDAPITSAITLVGLGAGAEISGMLHVSGAGRLTLRNVSVNP